MRQIAAVAFGITLLQGCAFTGNNRTFEHGHPLASPTGAARIFVYSRPAGVGGDTAPVALDGNIVGGVPPHGSLRFDVIPGRHVISAAGTRTPPLILVAKPGQTIFVHLSTEQQDANLKVVDPTIGSSAMSL